VAGKAILTVETVGQLARRVGRLEEVLESHRDWGAPDRRGFDSLRRRLADHGIENEMESDDDDAPRDGRDQGADDE
jgi:hypothetical protein